MIDQAARRLLAAYDRGEPVPPPSETFPGMTLADAYRVQQAQVRYWLGEGDLVRGHKIGLASMAMQRQMGVDQPDYGHLTGRMFFEASAPVPAGAFLQPRVEPEVAFVLKERLRGPVSAADVVSATEYVLAALEIVDSRVEDWRITIVDTVADNASSGGVLLGDTPVPLSEVDPSRLACTFSKNAAPAATGTGGDVLGSPVNAVAWLANKLGTLGVSLEPGHVILSGSVTQALAVTAGDVVHADFGELGQVSATFAR